MSGFFFLRLFTVNNSSNYADAISAISVLDLIFTSVEFPPNPRICTNPDAAAAFLLCRLTDSMPVRAYDFSQSCVEGPRILPYMYARPGQREQVDTFPHAEQFGRSLMRMDRTSFNCSE